MPRPDRRPEAKVSPICFPHLNLDRPFHWFQSGSSNVSDLSGIVIACDSRRVERRRFAAARWAGE